MYILQPSHQLIWQTECLSSIRIVNAYLCIYMYIQYIYIYVEFVYMYVCQSIHMSVYVYTLRKGKHKNKRKLFRFHLGDFIFTWFELQCLTMEIFWFYKRRSCQATRQILCHRSLAFGPRSLPTPWRAARSCHSGVPFIHLWVCDICVYIYIYIYIYIYTYGCLHVYMYVYVYMYLCICVYVNMYIYINIYLYIIFVCAILCVYIYNYI